MSIPLYNSTVQECSRYITRRYSTSFSLGIRMLSPKFQTPVYSIYGFVRFADEIVDTFHDHDKKLLLDEFRRETWLAIERKISLNPVLHAFQMAVNEYQIDHKLIEAFLYSMEMDIEENSHDQKSYETYIYGSAEVVGLMCLQVFCERDIELYNRLEPHAKSLGAAFQKVNFLRDMGDDYQSRGRVYFPNLNWVAFNLSSKKEIEADIQKDFDHALEGIRQLPKGAQIGVYLAYRYYTKLFRKIKGIQPERIMQERIRINNVRKISILLRSFARHSMNML
ncbi:MAG: phytoene/squalene synthase family protein [Bacteroidetes bacterium]|nr:phytoene/squalene synthase family protein [Bacteroidota bacterium]